MATQINPIRPRGFCRERDNYSQPQSYFQRVILSHYKNVETVQPKDVNYSEPKKK